MGVRIPLPLPHKKAHAQRGFFCVIGRDPNERDGAAGKTCLWHIKTMFIIVLSLENIVLSFLLIKYEILADTGMQGLFDLLFKLPESVCVKGLGYRYTQAVAQLFIYHQLSALLYVSCLI